jgi:drug/metabolite transporter (DMT)-like permease
MAAKSFAGSAAGHPGRAGSNIFICSLGRLARSRTRSDILFASAPIVLLLGWLALGEVPSTLQLIGLIIVLCGFRLAQKV